MSMDFNSMLLINGNHRCQVGEGQQQGDAIFSNKCTALTKTKHFFMLNQDYRLLDSPK